MSAEGLDAIENVLGPGPEGFPKFWEKCSKTGGSKGFAMIDALTGEEMEEPKKDSKQEAPKQPNKEILTSRDGKTIGMY